jgi:hypothetical protein
MDLRTPNSNARLAAVLAAVASAMALAAARPALGLQWHVDASNHQASMTADSPQDSRGLYNPLETIGLRDVASAAVSYDATATHPVFVDGTYYQGRQTRSGSAQSVVFGSDSSNTAESMANRNYEGLGIEPMAGVTIQFRSTRTDQYAPTSAGGQSANASITVIHRVTLRPGVDTSVSPGLLQFLISLNEVPVRLDYRMEASAIGFTDPLSGHAVGGGSAGMSVAQILSSGSQKTIFADGLLSGDSRGGSVDETVQLNLRHSIGSLVQDYAISAYASATVYSSMVPYYSNDVEATAQASVDPFLYIDPDWNDPTWGSLAPYFAIQQESALAPGGWEEVTRTWMAPIPEPSTWSLLLAGLAGMGGAVWRKRRVGRPDR